MNNREWLYSLEPCELKEWFEEEHEDLELLEEADALSSCDPVADWREIRVFGMTLEEIRGLKYELEGLRIRYCEAMKAKDDIISCQRDEIERMKGSSTSLKNALAGVTEERNEIFDELQAIKRKGGLK